MKLDKGLYTNCSPIDQPPGTWRFAKNLIDTGVTKALESEYGFTEYSSLPTLDGTEVLTTYLIGAIPVGNAVVFFLTDNTDSEIGLWSPGSGYSTVYNESDLNFSSSSPIEGEYRINVNNERIVSWIDNINTPRILNIDDLSTVSSISDLDVFRDVDNPSMTASINDTGGSLATAAYIPITRYEGEDGSVTQWFVHDKTIFINDDASSLPFNECDGAEAGTISNKSFTLIFQGCDQRFETLTVGYIKIQGQVTTVHNVTSKPLAATTTVVITGSESDTETTLDETLTSPATYKIAKAITQVKGQLVLGNLTSEGVPDLQPYALGIKINHGVALTNVISNTDNNKDRAPQTFMPGEVYAFYLGVELLSGAWVFYHIPGRQAQAGETSSLSLSGLSYKKYQVEDTAYNGSASTNMGYWENEGEVYPNDSAFDGTSLGYEDLRAQNVRHHRFPTLRSIVDAAYSANSSVGITHLPRLRISVSNVQIPASIQSSIKRWKIFYARKTNSDSVVLGSDLLQASAAIDSDSSVRWGTGGNWEIEGEYTASKNSVKPLKYDTIRSHCLDFLYDQSSANPVLAWFAYRLRRTDINTPYSGFRSNGGMFTRNNPATTTASAIVDYTVSASTSRISAGSEIIRRIDDFRYLPHNTIDGSRVNLGAEGAFVGDLQGSLTEITSSLLYNRCLTNPGSNADTNFLQLGTADESTYNGLEDTWLMMFGRILSDVHSSFSLQDLIPTEQYATPSATVLNNIDGGDTFMCYMSYAAFGPLSDQGLLGGQAAASSYGEFVGVRTWKAYIGYSRNNWNFRHEEEGNIYTKYHGKTDMRELYTPFAEVGIITTTLLNITEADPNQIKYNLDYSTQNTYFPAVIFTPDLVNETNLSTTLIWSPPQGEETKEVSWRTFPSGNRYTMPKNKGVITNLQGVGNRDIIIHHERALFKTRTDTSIQSADSENIFLKSNDFFSIPPEEIVSASGAYAGTKNKFACIMTVYGYFFPDVTTNRVFLYNGKTLEDIGGGMSNFFTDNVTNVGDNPFTGAGYTAVYDNNFDRIIFSKKGSFTISYNPIEKHWVSFHSYQPNYMFNIGATSYAMSSLIPHSVGTNVNRLTLFNGTSFPMLLDAVFTPGERVIFDGVKWRAEVFSSDTTLSYDSGLQYITVSTNDQTTGKIQVIEPTTIGLIPYANTRNIHGERYFNQLRDISIAAGFRTGILSNHAIDLFKVDTGQSWFNKRKIIDTFAICQLEYSGKNQFLLYDVSPIINSIHER